MKNLKMLLCLFPFFFLLQGCSATFKNPSIEEYGMIGVLGFDLEEDNRINLSAVVPEAKPQAEEVTRVFNTKVFTTHQGVSMISRKSEMTMNLGQLRVVFFSSDLAKTRGIITYVKDLYRDPKVGDNVYIAIVDGKVLDLLNKIKGNFPPEEQFFYQFLNPREDVAFSPFTTIHSYIHESTDNISDPMVPLITIGEKDKIILNQIALFKNRKMIAIIGSDEAKLLQGMAYRHKLPALTLTLPSEKKEGRKAQLSFVTSDLDILTNKNINTPIFDLEMHLRGVLEDYNGSRDLAKQENMRILENEISKQLEKETIQLISKLQKLEVDPIGLGEKLRMYYQGPWSKELWDDVYSRAKIRVHVDTELVNTGSVR